MRFAPRSSGKITFAFKAYFVGHTLHELFTKIFKSLAPGKAAGGFFNRTTPGGKVCHLESGLPMRFAPRSLGKITLAFKVYFTDHTIQKLFVKLFKSLAPGRAAGGIFNRTASGDQGKTAPEMKRVQAKPLPTLWTQ